MSTSTNAQSRKQPRKQSRITQAQLEKQRERGKKSQAVLRKRRERVWNLMKAAADSHGVHMTGKNVTGMDKLLDALESGDMVITFTKAP